MERRINHQLISVTCVGPYYFFLTERDTIADQWFKSFEVDTSMQTASDFNVDTNDRSKRKSADESN